MNTESAMARGLNPFAPHLGGEESRSDSAKGVGEVYDERAKGIDGDLLDAMLKGRWQEGHSTGYEDGHAAARQSYPQIFEDGFSTGLRAGANEAAAELASRLLPILQNAGGALADIADRTRSADLKEVADRQLAEIRVVLDQEVGHHTAEPGVRIGEGIPNS